MGTIQRYAKAYLLSVEEGISLEEADATIARRTRMEEEIEHAERLRLIHHAPSAHQEKQAISGVDRSDSKDSSKRPPLQQAFQESEILRVIGELGYDAKALPVLRKQENRKGGVKSKVREIVPMNSKGIFDKAWGRLRANGDIQDAD